MAQTLVCGCMTESTDCESVPRILNTKAKYLALMTAKKLARLAPIEQEVPDRAPRGWREAQQPIAEDSGLALLLVEGYQPPALVV